MNYDHETDACPSVMTPCHRELSSATCIFVSSSDHTRDVFLNVFAHFNRMWPDCPFPCYVGLTTGAAGETLCGFRVIPAMRESGWASELADQIRSLPAEVSRVLLLLDDFLLLAPVDGRSVAGLVEQASALDLHYLRLKPVERSWLVAMVRRVAASLGSRKFHRVSHTEPYFSSLQAAIWRRDHLLASLEKAETIWHFEYVMLAGASHWAVVSPALQYRHVVQRGSWRSYAPALFRRIGAVFVPGDRFMRPSSDVLLYIWEKGKFGVIGYTGMRLKRSLRSGFSGAVRRSTPSGDSLRAGQHRGDRQRL